MRPDSNKTVSGNIWRFGIRLSVTLILVIFLVASIGVRPILEVFLTVDVLPGIMVVMGLLLLFLLGACNVWLLLNGLQSIAFFTFLRTYSYSWATSLITPGQAGDVSIILFMRRHGIPVSTSSVAYLVDKLMTLVVFAVIGWYGCSYLIPELKWMWFVVFGGTALVLPTLIILLRFSIFNFKCLSQLQQRITSVFIDLDQLKARWHILVLNLAVTIVKWAVVSSVFWMAFQCFNTTVNWPHIGVIPILSTLVGYIPISLAGIGTVELSAVFLFGKIGLVESVVLSVYILLRVLQYLLAGLLMLLFARINPKKDTK